MTIDTKRLATDPGYWDEVSGDIWATDYNDDEKYFFCPKGYWMAGSGRWVGFNNPETYDLIKDQCKTFPRPQKPEVEWDGSEMVKAGHRLEARADGNPWLRGEIMYRSEEGVVFRPDDGGCELFWRFCMFHVEFRPIRTKEQRQRDNVINLAFSCLSEFREASQVLGDLYDAGMLRVDSRDA